jgi:hypothetical protein
MYIPGAWAKAERTVFNALLEAIPNSIEGNNAFLAAVPPGVYNVWAYSMEGGGDAQETWNCKVSSVKFPAKIEGLYADRAMAIAACEHVMAMVPIENSGNVQLFRIESKPGVKVDYIPMPDEKTLRVWILQIPCLCVFNGNQ